MGLKEVSLSIDQHLAAHRNGLGSDTLQLELRKEGVAGELVSRAIAYGVEHGRFTVDDNFIVHRSDDIQA